MYRKTTLLCLLALLILQGCAQESKKGESLVLKSIYEVTKEDVNQTSDTYGLKGDVKIVKQKGYLVPKDSVVDLSGYELSDLSEDFHYPLLAGAGMNHDCKLTFNEGGKLLYRIARGERFSSETVETDTMHYNVMGELTRIENRLVGDDFAFHTSTVFDYDEKGHLVRQLRNGQPDIQYTYDEAKSQVRVAWHDNDQFMFDNVYTYDKFGLNIETHNYKEDGSLEVHWVREYDDSGDISKEIQYYPNGDSYESKKPKEDKTVKVYRQYDKNGNCTKRIIVDANDRITIRERKFEYYQ